MRTKSLLAFLATTSAAVVSATSYPEAPPVFDASGYSKWTRKSGDSRLAKISVPFTDSQGGADSVDLLRLDLLGNAYERGYAHGALLAKEIFQFVTVGLPMYYVSEVMSIDIDDLGLPDAISQVLKLVQAKAAAAAPAAFDKALEWVYQTEESYIPADLLTEMDGIADGMCATLGSSCNPVEWAAEIRRVNMLPELIRMACTMFGAWGPATKTGNLMQLRALDFGGGPFANFTILQVHRPTDARAFASVAFPGMVGVITGVSQDGIGISEKVWMKYGGPTSLLPGSYDGEADVFVIRDILEKFQTRAEAEEYVRNAARTWAIWLGVGDPFSQRMDIIGYKQDSAEVYTDVTISTMTGQPYLDSVVYVDKHPQPSGEGPTGSLPTALADFHGQIDQAATATIAKYHRTGDLHIAIYDYGVKKLWVSIGRIDAKGNYGVDGEWKAYNRPYLEFDFDELWEGRL